MNEITVYEGQVEQSQIVMSRLTNEVLPNLALNLSAHMGDFVSTYKELQMLRVGRLAELKRLEMDRSKGLEKFHKLVDKTQERLGETLQMIKEFQKKIIEINVNTEEERHSQELLLKAMHSCQMQYMTEMQALINL